MVPVSDQQALSELIARDQVFVGLMAIDETSLDMFRSDIEFALYEAHRVEWIGVTTSGALNNSNIRRFISSRLFDYHRLPVDNARLGVSIGRAYGMARLGADGNSQGPIAGTLNMVGVSAAIQRVKDLVTRFSQVDAPILVTGESGTGKELIARAIHNLSNRSCYPLVTLNCGAIPEHLIQSELFGHEKGAFTGAVKQKIGRIEAAARGTLFLDEVGDLPHKLQVNLLRFLQEGTIERLGGLTSNKVDVRVVAATHIDLENSIRHEKFRQDLFYRLNVLRVRVPPLRERPEDIEPLANLYFHKFSRECGAKIKGFSQCAWDAMKIYDWPGNVRELKNRVRRATLLCGSRTVSPSDLGFDEDNIPNVTLSLAQVREEAEKKAIELSLFYTGNNVSAASKLLDISRVSLYRLMDKHHLSPNRTS